MPRKAQTVDATGDTIVQSQRTILYGYDVEMFVGTCKIEFKDGARVVFSIEIGGNHSTAGSGNDGSRRMSGLNIPFEDGLTITRSAAAARAGGGNLVVFYD